MVSHSFCLLLNGMQTKSLAAAFLKERTAWWHVSKLTNKNNNQQVESCSSKVTNHHGSIKEMQQ